MPTKLTTETFIQKAKLVHGDRYDYSQIVYKHSKTKVKILCREHGEFQQKPTNHISGKGCPICGQESLVKVLEARAKSRAVKASSEFATKANLVHNNKYDYSLVDYKGSHTKIKILCREHGEFVQQLTNHLSGKGCPECALSEQGWTRTKFKDKCIKNNNGLGILYVLGCWSDNKTEVFIKIGITSLSIKIRYAGTKMPYNFKVLHEIVGSPEYIYDLETKLHRKSKNYKYTPAIPFGGSSSECFKADKDYLKKLNLYMNDLIPSFNP